MQTRPRDKKEGCVPDSGIQIFIGDDGRPFCDPYYAHVKPGATVRWNYSGGWAIEFKNSTPLEGGKLTAANDHPEAKIDGKARKGHYVYTVIAVDDERGTQKIYYDLACPELIVD